MLFPPALHKPQTPPDPHPNTTYPCEERALSPCRPPRCSHGNPRHHVPRSCWCFASVEQAMPSSARSPGEGGLGPAPAAGPRPAHPSSARSPDCQRRGPDPEPGRRTRGAASTNGAQSHLPAAVPAAGWIAHPGWPPPERREPPTPEALLGPWLHPLLSPLRSARFPRAHPTSPP